MFMPDAAAGTQELVDGRGCRIQDIFSDRPFRLDYFQRAYVWKTQQVRRLVDDLTDCFRRDWSPRHRPDQALSYPPYFLGPFVSYKRDGERFLADGQQRIITLTLLLLRLRRLAKEQDLSDTAFTLEHLIAKPVTVGGRAFAIDVDDYKPFLEGIWSGNGYSADAQDPNIVHFHRAYAEISAGLSARLPDDALEHFVTWLCDRVSLVEIDAKDHKRAWNIFQAMNYHGVRLEPVDYLKGYLLSDRTASRIQAEAAWQQMFKRLERIDKHAPLNFVTTVFRALYSDIERVPEAPDLGDAVHEWVRLHEGKIWPERRDGVRAEFVVSTLQPLSKTYRRLLAAARELDPALPSVYFNSRHGLETQFDLMMACCRPGESETLWLPKARLVADFVDFLFVLHGVNNDTLTDAELRQMATRLLPQLCKAATPADVQNILATEHVGFDMELRVASELRCRNDNKPFIRYLLARITAWLDVGAQRGDFIAQYLAHDGGKPRFEIEHMYPNAFRAYGQVTPVEYALQRTRIGALLLLDGSKNAGLGGEPLEQKIDLYRDPASNLLAASLHPATYERGSAKFKRFIKTEKLHGQFVPLPPGHEMVPFVNDRCALYQAIVERIWDPARIGIVPAKPPMGAKTRSRKRRSYGVEFGDLVTAGLIVGGDVLSGTLLGKTYSAVVLADGRIRTHSGGAFDSPSRAAMDTLERVSSNGWTFWHLTRTGVRIDAVRDEYLAR